MVLENLSLLQKLNSFDTDLYQFRDTRTSDITFMGRDQELKWLALSLYPISFCLYSSFNLRKLILNNLEFENVVIVVILKCTKVLHTFRSETKSITNRQ